MVVWKCNLLMLWLSQIMVMAGYDALNPFISLFLREELGLTDPKRLAFFISAYQSASLIGYGISNPIWGFLGDRYGMKPMLLRGTFLTAFFWPMMAYVKSPWVLIAIRCTTSILAGTTAASQMMVARTAPAERQGFALGILTTAIWGGGMIGNVIGGLIIHYFNYKSAFWTCGIMYFLAGAFILFTQDSGSSRKKEQEGNTAKSPWWKLPNIVWILVGLFFLLGMLRNMEIPYVVLRIRQIKSAETAAYWTGIVSACVAFGAILSGVVIGRMIDKYPAHKLLLPILGGMGVFMCLQGILPTLGLFATSRTLCYFVAGALQPFLQKQLTLCVPSKRRGISFGIANTSTALGGVFASALGALLMVHYGVCGVFIGTGLLAFLAYPVFYAGIKASESAKNSKKA